MTITKVIRHSFSRFTTHLSDVKKACLQKIKGAITTITALKWKLLLAHLTSYQHLKNVYWLSRDIYWTKSAYFAISRSPVSRFQFNNLKENFKIFSASRELPIWRQFTQTFSTRRVIGFPIFFKTRVAKFKFINLFLRYSCRKIAFFEKKSRFFAFLK